MKRNSPLQFSFERAVRSRQISGATKVAFEAAKELIFYSCIGSAVILEDGVNIPCYFRVTDSEHFRCARSSIETP